MTDLHSHTLFSDGVLLPSELARRAIVKGYEVLALTDHVDHSTIEIVIPALVQAALAINRSMKIKIIPGCEITHIDPSEIGALAVECRKLGARIIVVHGETLVEPVKKGTNRYGLEADIDILAHPGILSDEEAVCAASKGIAVEITSRSGHSLGNGIVAKLWYRHRFPLVVNSDSHAPGDLIDRSFASRLLSASGIAAEDIETVLESSRAFAMERFCRG
ncbi:MAG: histidinol phosphate phosphatase domain-containing protein [Candidatus Ratteibacteria bacterium]